MRPSSTLRGGPRSGTERLVGTGAISREELDKIAGDRGEAMASQRGR